MKNQLRKEKIDVMGTLIGFMYKEHRIPGITLTQITDEDKLKAYVFHILQAVLI